MGPGKEGRRIREGTGHYQARYQYNAPHFQAQLCNDIEQVGNEFKGNTSQDTAREYRDTREILHR